MTDSDKGRFRGKLPGLGRGKITGDLTRDAIDDLEPKTQPLERLKDAREILNNDNKEQ